MDVRDIHQHVGAPREIRICGHGDYDVLTAVYGRDTSVETERTRPFVAVDFDAHHDDPPTDVASVENVVIRGDDGAVQFADVCHIDENRDDQYLTVVFVAEGAMKFDDTVLKN